MILSTTDAIEDKKIIKVIGLVRGNTVRCRDVEKDMFAFLRNVVGGEVMEYTKLLSEAREQAIDRMVEEATSLGANAVVGIRFSTSSIAQGAAEMLVYGTAVMVE